MTRRQLGDALRVLLRETHYDMERSAEALIQMHAAGAEVINDDGAPPVDALCQAAILDVAIERGVTVDQVKAHGGRSKALVRIRHEAAWRCRQIEPRPSYPEIARALGLTNHTSAIHAVRRHQQRLDIEAAATAAAKAA